MPVKTAYEILHLHDEIIPGVREKTAKAVEEKLANKVMSTGARVQENGSSSLGAVPLKTGVQNMTREMREDINRRAARGERIILSDYLKK